MRGATHCAQHLKGLLGSLRHSLGRVGPPPVGDPVTQMLLGVLSRDVPESKAREALDALRAMVVDYNELRVIPPIEMAELLGDYPDVRLKCEDISRSLNRIFALTHTVSLDHLLELGRKEARAWLDQIEGLEPYTRARVRLLGLQQHAFPLDEAMWAYARQMEIVDRKCSLEEAQNFLERQVPEAESIEIFALLRRQAWTECGAAVRRGEVERIQSVPPDRTARNMLQMIGAAEPDALAGDDGEVGFESAEPPPAEAQPRAKRSRRKEQPATRSPAKPRPEKAARTRSEKSRPRKDRAPKAGARPAKARAEKSRPEKPRARRGRREKA